MTKPSISPWSSAGEETPLRTREARPRAAAAAEIDPPAAGVPVRVEPCVLVREGWHTDRTGAFLLLCVVLALVAGGVGLEAGWLDTGGRGLTFLAAVVAASAAGLRLMRRALRRIHEYTLDADGITLWRNDPDETRPELTRIPWTDIAAYLVNRRPDRVSLKMYSGDRRLIELPPTPIRQAREFVERFTREAERHPRSAPVPPQEGGSGPLVTVPSLLAVSAAAALLWAGTAASGRFHVPLVWRGVGLAAVILGSYLFPLWLQLGDSDLAHADRASRLWKGRTRNRLRAWLGIRPV